MLPVFVQNLGVLVMVAGGKPHHYVFQKLAYYSQQGFDLNIFNLKSKIEINSSKHKSSGFMGLYTFLAISCN